jgi:muramidase (phage lysozyme)
MSKYLGKIDYCVIKNALKNTNQKEREYLSEHFQNYKYFSHEPNKGQKIILDILKRFDVLIELEPPDIDECIDKLSTYYISDHDFFKVYFPII